MQDADQVIINHLRSLFLEAEDETELKFETDEDKETPKVYSETILAGWRQEEWLAFKDSRKVCNAASDDPERWPGCQVQPQR